MSIVRFTARPLMTAGIIAGVAAVAAFTVLLATPPEARSQTVALSRAEVKSCNLAFCSWDEFAPTASAFAESFGPPGLFSLRSYIDCIGCAAGENPFFHPPGFAFGWSKLHTNNGAAGRLVSEAAHASNGSSGLSFTAVPVSSSGPGGGGEVASTTSAAATGTPNGGEVPVTVNPEPGTVVLLATALFVLVPVVRRQRRS